MARGQRRWSLAEEKWLVKCLTKAVVDAPSTDHRFGRIRNMEAIREEFRAGGYGDRSDGSIG